MDPSGALIAEYAKAGLLVLTLAVAAGFAVLKFLQSQESRISEIKENNKLLTEVANKSATAMSEQAQANNKQTETIASQVTATNSLADRLSKVELVLENLKSKVGL